MVRYLIMIPIISLASVVSALVSLFATWRVLRIYQQRPSDALRYFAGWFGVLAAMMVVYSLPELFIKNPVGNAVVDVVGSLLVYVSCVLLIQIPFIFMNRREWGVLAGIILATAALVYFISLLMNPAPSMRTVSGPYVFWLPQYAQWLRTYTAFVAGVTTMLFTLTFLYLGIKGRADIIVFRRSMYLAGGMFLLMTAAFTVLAFPVGKFPALYVVGAGAMVFGCAFMFYGLVWLPSEDGASLISDQRQR